ncbi:hypothetical protein [Paraburkholderia aromaticivorans]|uniref:hypothetical protein n=1 Tax=Paraburkholderia aromaticivorans TaxID=2026199 RepID=UPI00145600B3|nr:hypothetical protein [Paraburkholderia aromaticivorans]
MQRDYNYTFQGKRQLRPDLASLSTTGTGPTRTSPCLIWTEYCYHLTRRPTSLGEQMGSCGIVVVVVVVVVVVGVGEGGERGFEMAYRFNCIGKQLVKAGVNLVLIYPKASSRHVLDPLSVGSSHLQGSPVLLLDGDGHFFRRPQPARSLSFAHMDRGLRLIASANIDLQHNAWADLLQTFLSSPLESDGYPAIQIDCRRSTRSDSQCPP